MPSLASRCLLLALLVLPPASPAFAQPASDPAFDAAFASFSKARQGDTAQLDAAVTAFQATPGNPAMKPLYSAYLGSACTLQGKAAWMPWNKMKYTDKGLDAIDQALAGLRPEHDRLLVQGVPASLATRLVAAATFVAVPDGLFHRRAAGKTLLAEMRRSPLLATAPAGFRAELDAVETRLKEAEK
jgi:hypothetical protein